MLTATPATFRVDDEDTTVVIRLYDENMVLTHRFTGEPDGFAPTSVHGARRVVKYLTCSDRDRRLPEWWEWRGGYADVTFTTRQTGRLVGDAGTEPHTRTLTRTYAFAVSNVDRFFHRRITEV